MSVNFKRQKVSIFRDCLQAWTQYGHIDQVYRLYFSRKRTRDWEMKDGVNWGGVMKAASAPLLLAIFLFKWTNAATILSAEKAVGMRGMKVGSPVVPVFLHRIVAEALESWGHALGLRTRKINSRLQKLLLHLRAALNVAAEHVQIQNPPLNFKFSCLPVLM